MIGFFGKKGSQNDSKNNSGELKLSKKWVDHIKEIKRQRAIFCQNKGMSMNDMGRDLAHIERRAKMYFNFAVEALREGKNPDAILKDLTANHVGSEIDKQILEGLFDRT